MASLRHVKQTISSQIFFFELGGITKHLMTGPAGNSEHRFLGFALGNIVGVRETKLTVSLGTSH